MRRNRLQIGIFLALTILAGCSAKQIHTINRSAIQDNVTKQFKIGMVKVAIPGNFTPLSNAFDQKVGVLNVIPFNEICKTLETTYGINIDSSTDGLVHDVFQIYGAKTLVPYFGNTKYTKRTLLKSLIGIGQKPIKAKNPSEVIDITFELQIPPFGIGTFTCWYSVMARAGGQEIFSHRGVLTKGPMPTKNLVIDFRAMWEIMRESAKKMNHVFLKDLENRSEENAQQVAPADTSHENRGSRR